MVNMPVEFAQDLYCYEYYYRPNFNIVAERSELIAKELFDTGVNTGYILPSKFFQRLMNVFNNKGSYYEDIVVDGIIGRNTMSAYDKLCQKRGNASVENLIYNCLNALQCVNYIELAEKRMKDEEFVFGWIINRVDYQPF